MANGNGKHPATTALRAFLDREVDHGMRVLGIRSLAAMRRESDRYPRTEENEYPGPKCLEARVRCLELLEALADPSATDLDLETADQWIMELRDKLLPKASRRPLTAAEFRPVVDAERRDLERIAIKDRQNAREWESQEFASWITGEDRFFWAVDGLDRAAAGLAAA